MDLVNIEKEWFINFNMAMIIFSATLVIHINCLWNSTILLRKLRSNKIIQFNFIQACFAVSCHLNRITDYFFKTNCQFKGYYNWISYGIAATIMDIISVYRIWKFMKKSTFNYKLKSYKSIN